MRRLCFRREQGTSNYLRDLLQYDNKLGPYLDQHPECRILVEQAILEDCVVPVTDFVIDESVLNRGTIQLTSGTSVGD